MHSYILFFQTCSITYDNDNCIRKRLIIQTINLFSTFRNGIVAKGFLFAYFSIHKKGQFIFFVPIIFVVPPWQNIGEAVLQRIFPYGRRSKAGNVLSTCK